jgi:predicted nucleotidyltransferase component of viral defense system
MKREVSNVPRSIHDRLLRTAKQEGRTFQELFYYYAIERFLFRLANSPYSNKFVLKGGLMFFGWGISLRRSTRDIDVQGYVMNTIEELEIIVKEICSQDVEDDGMRFDTNTVRGEPIITEANYQGARIFFRGYLDNALIQLHLDISFGNPIVPSEILVYYPSVLGLPAFPINGYSIETTIAEKLQAMVSLGRINDRLKDFFDLWLLSQEVNISGRTLVKAIEATFRTRNTDIPLSSPDFLSSDFADKKNQEWERFLKRCMFDLTVYPSFSAVLSILKDFLLPVMHAALNNAPFDCIWIAGESWSPILDEEK